ncbi:Mycothiol acetyltransferase [uncultured archaeon]|nr:Mycothiol acetyltransferase [uncultured archaeon]
MMIIRTATKKDIPELTVLFTELLKQHQTYPNYPQLHKNLASRMNSFVKKEMAKSRTKFFIAEVDKKVIGFMIAYTLKRPAMYQSRRFGWIEGIVAKEYRRKGIGESLTKEALKWLKKKGVKRVELEVNVKNEKGINAWVKYGFKEYEMILYKSLE